MESIIKSLNILTDEEFKDLEFFQIEKTLKKNEYFIREGKVCDEIALIKTGITRSFHVTESGDEITNNIAFKSQLLSAFSSFITQKPTEENIQALIETELVIIKKKDLFNLYEKDPNWQKLSRVLTEMLFIEMEKRVLLFQKYNAKQRYNLLISNYPDYVKYIPLQYLASYLGITIRHLSRIRKEVTL